ncbi:MAG: hypothetical protein IJ538_02885 [Clostridia bacterium]|nr:hypothetical protein [Clostridia bacterium]
MANIINLTEKGNRLDITDTYTPIVCGNSNYSIHFSFSEMWQSVVHKTAIFIVEGKKYAVDFTGTDVKVPALPNAPFVFVALISADEGDEIISTTAVRLRLEKTPILDDMGDFSPVKNYISQINTLLNKIETGDFVVNQAENAIHAESATIATSATSAESASYAETAGSASTAESADYATSSGHSETAGSATSANTATTATTADNATHATTADNATHATSADTATTATNATSADNATHATSADTATTAANATHATSADSATTAETSANATYATSAGTASVAIAAQNVSNVNLLINGDFKINQRGKTTYSTANKYTVDRWKLVSGSLSVVSNGINLNGTITQTLEKVPQGNVAVSSNAGTVSYSNGVVTLTASNKVITWVKLEIGSAKTPFSPKTYAEELSDCQRYYNKLNVAYLNGFNSGNDIRSVRAFLPLPVEMKSGVSLIKENTRCWIHGSSGYFGEATNIELFGRYSNGLALTITLSSSVSPAADVTFICEITNNIEFESEI